MKAFEVLYRNPVPYGLYPTYINPNTGKPTNKVNGGVGEVDAAGPWRRRRSLTETCCQQMVTFGALGDSFYEYLLKVWLQGGRKDPRWREMYDRAMDGVVEKMLQTSTPSRLLYMSDWDGTKVRCAFANQGRMHHSAHSEFRMLAELPQDGPSGLLPAWRARAGRVHGPQRSGVGASAARPLHRQGADVHVLPDVRENGKRRFAIGRGFDDWSLCSHDVLRRTAPQATGIAPEYVNFVEGKDLVAAPGAPFYILRPETAESLFVLNQLTKEPM
jgi:mannosyl-oligosaccharide alpha-1,2-mannosidase